MTWVEPPDKRPDVRLFVQGSLEATVTPVQTGFFTASFTEALSSDIGWTAVLDASTVAAMGLDLRPWRAAVYLQVGDYLVPGLAGPRSWNRQDESNAGRVVSRGGSWMGYLAARLLATTKNYTATEQFDIVSDLLATVQTGQGDLSIALDRDPADSGVTRDRSWPAHERNTIAQLIRQLGEVDDGFEWMPAATWSTGSAPARLLRLGYPDLGDPDAVLPVLVDGAGCKVTAEEYVSADTATAVHAAGQSDTGGDRPVSVATAAAQAGLPTLERLVQHDTTYNPITLGKHAEAELARAQATVSVTVDVYDLAAHPVELFRPGDRFELIAEAEGMHQAASAVQPWRVVARTVNVNEAGIPQQTLQAMRDDQLVVPGPWRPTHRAMLAFKIRRRAERMAELEARVGTA